MKITIIGSTRFLQEMQQAEVDLTLAGHVVHSHPWPNSLHRGETLSPEQRTMLDVTHLQKIDGSDVVVLIGYQADSDTYYLGDSTRLALAWAIAREKRVAYWPHAKESLLNGGHAPADVMRVGVEDMVKPGGIKEIYDRIYRQHEMNRMFSETPLN